MRSKEGFSIYQPKKKKTGGDFLLQSKRISFIIIIFYIFSLLTLGIFCSIGRKVSAAWLPDFGRVWNEGPRSSTKRQYQSEKQAEYKNFRRKK